MTSYLIDKALFIKNKQSNNHYFYLRTLLMIKITDNNNRRRVGGIINYQIKPDEFLYLNKLKLSSI